MVRLYLGETLQASVISIKRNNHDYVLMNVCAMVFP